MSIQKETLLEYDARIETARQKMFDEFNNAKEPTQGEARLKALQISRQCEARHLWPHTNRPWGYSMNKKLPIGSNKCKCSACGEFFLTVAAFDAHRELVSTSPAYRRSCTTPQTSNWPFQRDAKGFWRLPIREYPEREAA